MELNELKEAMAAEILLLNNSLLEKTEAVSALSCELKKSRQLTEIRENNFKAQATEEVTRIEKIFHQEKVSQGVWTPITKIMCTVSMAISLKSTFTCM